MYKITTIQKAVNLMKEAAAVLEKLPIENIKLCISTGNKKIGHVMNVSLAPVISCGNCSGCMHYCYDIGDVLLREVVLWARMRNWVILNKDREEYFRRIELAISRRRKNFYFRWHVGGEIPDYDYFCRIVDIARRYPKFIFWTYTKMYWFVNRWCDENGGRDALPDNLKVMFSEWRGMPIDNPYGFPVFTVRFKGEDFLPDMYICPGNCDICKAACRGCVVGESVQAREH